MTRGRRVPLDLSGHPWRSTIVPDAPPDVRARAALAAASLGWALVLVSAAWPPCRGAEGLGGVMGLVALGVWCWPRPL